MRYLKNFAGLTLALGMLAAGPSIAAAQDWRYNRPDQYQYQPPNYGGQSYRENRYDRIEDLQNHIARDRARLNEAIRCGRDREAAREAADLARDQRLLQEQRSAGRAYYGPTRSYGFGWR